MSRDWGSPPWTQTSEVRAGLRWGQVCHRRCANRRKKEVSKQGRGEKPTEVAGPFRDPVLGQRGGAEMRRHQRLAAFQAAFSFGLPGRLFSNVVPE